MFWSKNIKNLKENQQILVFPVTVPKKPKFLSKVPKKCCTVQKKQKKTKFRAYGLEHLKENQQKIGFPCDCHKKTKVFEQIHRRSHRP